MQDDFKGIITIEPGKRSGKPCIRGMRITVYDVLSYMAGGMTQEEILEDFPCLTERDIRACLAYAAERDYRTVTVCSTDLRSASNVIAVPVAVPPEAQDQA